MYDPDEGEYDLTIYVPTRGRPDKLYDHETNFYSTTTINTRVVYILSSDDPKLDEYLKVPMIGEEPIVVTPDKRGFVDPLNMGYLQDRRYKYSYAVGFMGDDHFPRTNGWDQIMVDELIKMKSGFVYADDGFQHEAVPTQIAMTHDIPQTLGYMTYPALSHLYADDFWLALGNAIGRIKYLPEVLIEHMHPGAGKNKIDAGYDFSGSFTLDMRDKAIYQMYLDTELEADTKRLLAMMRRSGKL